MFLPERYTESMKDLLGEEYNSYIDSFNDKRLYGLRVNNLKISTDEFLKICRAVDMSQETINELIHKLSDNNPDTIADKVIGK